MTGLQKLVELDLEFKRLRYPNFPYPVRAKFSDKTANDLTRAVVRCFEVCGHFATRVSSTGTYRADLDKFVASQQKAGLPDVLAIIDGAPFGSRLSTETIGCLTSKNRLLLTLRKPELRFT